MDTLIENWNNGVNQEDINIIRKSEHSRKELRSENMVWHDLRTLKGFGYI